MHFVHVGSVSEMRQCVTGPADASCLSHRLRLTERYANKRCVCFVTNFLMNRKTERQKEKKANFGIQNHFKCTKKAAYLVLLNRTGQNKFKPIPVHLVVQLHISSLTLEHVY